MAKCINYRNTLPSSHGKRGQEAMNEVNILPQFQGIGIHDYWFPYFTHGLCNAHHLRELTFIHEQEKEGWAGRMKDFLIFAKNEVEKHLEKGILPQEILNNIE